LNQTLHSKIWFWSTILPGKRGNIIDVAINIKCANYLAPHQNCKTACKEQTSADYVKPAIFQAIFDCARKGLVIVIGVLSCSLENRRRKNITGASLYI
jgi:hypothetical protein